MNSNVLGDLAFLNLLTFKFEKPVISIHVILCSAVNSSQPKIVCGAVGRNNIQFIQIKTHSIEIAQNIYFFNLQELQEVSVHVCWEWSGLDLRWS